MSRDWITEQVDIIRNLKGQEVTRFIATEMAFRGGEGLKPPQFSDAALPFLQVDVLYLVLTAGRTVKFITYQNDDTWGLFLSSALQTGEPELDAGNDGSIFRTRELTSFPTGLINSVDVVLDSDGEISEIALDFSGDAILLVAGEVYEQWDGILDIHKGDESILLFRDPKAKSKIGFD